MKFSIVLPVRNGGALVKECVQSILHQTVADFTFYVLDNCSTDGTLEYLQSIKDDRVVIIPSDKSLTIEENWARIVAIEKNEFITLIGHDDVLAPHYLATMEQLIQQHPNATLYQTHFNFIDTDGNLIKPCKPMREKERAHEFLGSILTNSIDMMGTGFMMRAQDYDSLGGIPPYPNLLFADLEIFIKLAQKGYKATTPEVGFSYRLHQSTTKLSPDIKIHKAFERFIYFLQKLGNVDPEYASVIRQHGKQFMLTNCKALAHRLLRTPIDKREHLSVRKFIDQCKTYAALLIPTQTFDPLSVTSIRLAAIVDSNAMGRNLFLAFKKLYSKPVLK